MKELLKRIKPNGLFISAILGAALLISIFQDGNTQIAEMIVIAFVAVLKELMSGN